MLFKEKLCNNLYKKINQNEIQELIILFIVFAMSEIIINLSCESIYIGALNMYIESKKLILMFYILNIFIISFIAFLDEVKLLFKIVIMLIPVFFIHTLKLLNIEYYMGLFIIIISVFMIILYIILYLKFNQEKRKKWSRVVYRMLILVSLFNSVSLPSLMICDLKKDVSPQSNIEGSNKDLMIMHAMDCLKGLNKEKWNQIDKNKKRDCLQTIVNIESKYFGIDDVPNIEIVNLRELTIAQYNNQKNIIRINRQYLESKNPNEMVKTVLHECRHKYQYKVAELCNFSNIKNSKLLLYSSYPKKVKDSLNNYPSDTYNIKDYYFSFVEIDAREYEIEGIKEYNNMIPNMR